MAIIIATQSSSDSPKRLIMNGIQFHIQLTGILGKSQKVWQHFGPLRRLFLVIGALRGRAGLHLMVPFPASMLPHFTTPLVGANWCHHLVNLPGQQSGDPATQRSGALEQIQ